MSHIHYMFRKKTDGSISIGSGKHYHMACGKDGILVPTSAEYDESGHTHELDGKESSVPIVVDENSLTEGH